MLFLRLLCAVVDEPFSRFESLNQQPSEDSYNKILYEVVKFGEHHELERELDFIVQQLAYNPDNRLAPEKLCTEIQSVVRYLKVTKRVEELQERRLRQQDLQSAGKHRRQERLPQDCSAQRLSRHQEQVGSG